MIQFAIIGIIGGLNSACIGAYKDSPYENFSFLKYLRSLLIGLGASFILFYSLDATYVAIRRNNLYLEFAVIVALERYATEFIKLFLRLESQDKYSIPSIFHINGDIVLSFTNRLLSGLLYLICSSLLSLLISCFPLTEGVWEGFVLGLIAGFFVALGGGWKDVPFEGFNRRKFLRSPIIASIWGIYFSHFSDNPLLICIASGGAERMVTECIKTFFLALPPGKFSNKPLCYPDWIIKRNIFLPFYIFSWVAFLLILFIKV